MARVAVFDLDRTLLDVNSGRLWLQHELTGGRIGLTDALWAGWWLFRYSLGHEVGLDGVFDVAAEKLAGQAETDLERRATTWFEHTLRHRLRPGGAAALAAHRAAGDHLLLATSGLVYASRSAVEAFGLDDLVCTRFEVKEGRFTGRVSSLAVGPAKADRVAEWAHTAGFDLSEATFYTDSATDLSLLERVGKPVAVNPDAALNRVARRRGWEIVDWGRGGRAAPMACHPGE